MTMCVVCACIAVVLSRGANLQVRHGDSWLELTIEPTSPLAFVRMIRNLGVVMQDVGRTPTQA